MQEMREMVIIQIENVNWWAQRKVIQADTPS